MKKVFVLSAFALAAMGAHAELSIYGLLDASYGKSIADDIAGLKADLHSGGDDGNTQGNSTSRVGVKGSVDVGSGVKANFKLESNGITSEGKVNSPTLGRAAWVGLSGAYGEVRFGRQDSVPFQTMVGYDLNGASNGTSAWGYSTVAPWAPGRQSKAINYIAPKFGAFSAQVGLTIKGNDATAKDTLSLGVTYAAGPLSASLAYESKRVVGGDDFAAIAGSYDFGVAKVSLGYADAGNLNKGVTLGAATKLAGVTVGAQYGKNTKGDKDEAYELFANKEVFKNTTFYGQAGHYKNNLGDKGTGYSVGVIYTF